MAHRFTQRYPIDTASSVGGEEVEREKNTFLVLIMFRFGCSGRQVRDIRDAITRVKKTFRIRTIGVVVNELDKPRR